MSSTTSLSIVNGAIANLQDYLGTILPIMIPIIIAVAVLFAGIFWLKRLWHKKV